MGNNSRRAAITGIGVISPLGLTKEDYWSNLTACRSGVSNITLFDVSAFPTRIAAEIKGFDPNIYVKKKKSLKVMMRDMQFAIAAAQEAVRDAGLDLEGIDPTRFGVIFGAGMISADIFELAPGVVAALDAMGEFDIRKYGTKGLKQLFPLWLLKQLPNMISSHVSIMFNAQGPSNTITTGCSGSANAIGEAFRLIERGDAEVIISGGSSSRITPLKLIRYHKLGVLSRNNENPEKASRPFDARRDGFVIGEGAGLVIIEELEHAKRRGARIYSEITGYGSTVDIECGVDKRIDPSVKALAMKTAMSEAGLKGEEIDYISAHGNAIPFTDRLETAAVKIAFGEKAYSLPMSSIKGQIGDLGSASGAMGIISTSLAMERGLLPCTMNCENRDPECDLDYVPQTPREKSVKTALINSFDFMGQNVCLAIRKWG